MSNKNAWLAAIGFYTGVRQEYMTETQTFRTRREAIYWLNERSEYRREADFQLVPIQLDKVETYTKTHRDNSLPMGGLPCPDDGEDYRKCCPDDCPNCTEGGLPETMGCSKCSDGTCTEGE